MIKQQKDLIEQLQDNVKQGKTTLRAASEKINASRTSLYYYRKGLVKMPLYQYNELKKYLNKLKK